MKSISSKILAHELAWLILFLIMSLRLFFNQGYFYALLTLISLSLIVWNIFTKKAIWRFGFYIILMNIYFILLKYISPIINPEGKKDAFLYNIDCNLFGDFIGIYLQDFTNPILTEIFAIFYLLFLPQLLFFFIFYLFIKKHLTKKFFVGLMLLYAFGFLGYIFIPAIGPYDFLAAKFKQNLEGYFFFNSLVENYPKGSNLTDVFPSLHCGVSCYILLFNFKFDKIRFYLWLLPTILLWVSTVYLHYHYLIDCIVGFILAITCYYFIRNRYNEHLRL